MNSHNDIIEIGGAAGAGDEAGDEEALHNDVGMELSERCSSWMVPLPECRDQAASLFRQVCELEREFWEMAYSAQ